MQDNTKKLIQKNLEEFLPVAIDLAKDGEPPERIAEIFQGQQEIKKAQFYAKGNRPQSIKEIIRSALPDPNENGEEVNTSKAEWIFKDSLIKDGFKFEYQYPIGPYTADFLFDEFLVVEIDGPYHNNNKEHDEARDKYMQRLGYEVFRVPLDLMCNSPERVKESILERLHKKD
jgi:very-short-patch-repair endonuclease